MVPSDIKLIYTEQWSTVCDFSRKPQEYLKMKEGCIDRGEDIVWKEETSFLLVIVMLQFTFLVNRFLGSMSTAMYG